MSDREKELTVLIAEECRITAEMLPSLEYCRGLAFRMNRHLGGSVSIKFSTISDLICEFRWRGKYVAALYFHNTSPDEVRIRAWNNGEPMGYYHREFVWEAAFRPALADLISRDREDLMAVERKIGAVLLP
ncbi:MAG: hypothetical protein Q8Q41_02615 [bacterium]|nr:hypothetical protein [bacterium]